MDKDRVKGSAKQVVGSIKEATGKAIGDAQMKRDGKAEQIEGKTQNAVGRMKDTARDILKH
jgi:uncharacterized protein YjbJ (UPF0337 family)